MAEAKVGPMGMGPHRNDLDHYWQPLQERRRDQGKTSNVPSTNRFKEEKAHKSGENFQKNIEGRQ